MSVRIIVCFIVALAFFASGCSKDEPRGQEHEHDHDHAGCEGHDHACCQFHAKKETPAEPERIQLGKAVAGKISLSAVQVGPVKAGGWALIQIKTEQLLPVGSKVRAWIGHEQTMDRTLAEYCEGHDEYDAEVSVPKTIAPDMKWWIEVEPKGEAKAVASLALKP
jgi:hypothetical protein